MDIRQQLHRVAHSREVGPDINGVGEHERASDHSENAARKLRTEGRSKSVSCHHADTRAHVLHRSHQRPGDQRSPE